MKLICSLFITFLKIGAFTFGGGYAMIALLENEFVEKKKWLEKSEFLDMVAVAESTPKVNAPIFKNVINKEQISFMPVYPSFCK